MPTRVKRSLNCRLAAPVVTGEVTEALILCDFFFITPGLSLI
jgi:hypothetical protein